MEHELPVGVKLKFLACLLLLALLVAGATIGSVVYQRQAKIEAAELAKTQLQNVEAMKTSFPDYKNTKQFKESANMAMTKISVDSLPTTITAGSEGAPDCDAVPDATDYWTILKNSVEVANADVKNGWDFTPGGTVSIPATAEYGKYSVHYASDETCEIEEGVPPGWLQYHYEFKITPPCPTGVSLSAQPVDP